MEYIYNCTSENTVPINMRVRGVKFKNFKAEKHRHEYYEINFICSGNGIHTVGEESFEVSRGDVFMIPPQTVHSYGNTNNLDVFHLLYHPDYIKEIFPEASKVRGFVLFTEIEPFLRENISAPKFLHLNEMIMSEIERDLDIIDDAGRYRDQYVPFLRQHTAIKVLYELSEMCFHQLLNDEFNSKYEQQIFQALEYIHTNFDKKITVDELARLVYLSRSTFIRNFTLVTKMPPNKYVRQYRMSKAAELLQDAGMKKSEVARMCGFYDISHMNHSLK